MKNSNKGRLGIVLSVLLILYAMVIYKLFYWQVIKSPQLKELGIQQSSSYLEIPAKRGEILSSDNFPIATTRTSYLVYGNPKLSKEKIREYSDKLANTLNMEQKLVEEILSKDLYWVRIADKVDISKKLAIERLKIPGIGFQENDLRNYPEASMAAQLIGFLGKDENNHAKGYFGLEGYYNDQLTGRPGRMYMIHDALRNPILNDIREEKKINGRDLVLNIDRTVQFITDKKLKDGIEKYSAEGGSVIVMEPGTGKILAMSSLPQYHPQNYYNFDSRYYNNPVVSSLYEPGSTYKVLVMSAAIDMGVVNANTRCDICSGPVIISDYEIKTWNEKYFPGTTMSEVIQHSDNTGMVYVGKKIGINNMIKYMKLFGIGERTDIDLQGETTGVIRDSNSWYTIDLATATFGQGISLTPLQLLVAVNSIANGGNIVKPYVVSQIVTLDGKTISIKPKIVRRALSERTTKVMTEIMVNAVNKGESKWTKLENYKVAGKTGTAQIPILGHYDPKETIASFIGFFPADDPKISMLVLINKPKTSIYGSETAAPIFFSIAKELIKYYNIPPSY